MTKIVQNSRQNFILSPRFPRESCRSRRDLQLCSGNLGLRMKFCLEIRSIFAIWVRIQGINVGEMQKVGGVPRVSPKLWAHPNFSTPNPDQPQIDPAEAKIDRISRQNFILSPRFPLQSCRSRRDLQLSHRSLPQSYNSSLATPHRPSLQTV